MSRQRYEFDTEQNAIIEGLAMRLNIIGFVCFLIGLGVLLMMFVRTGNLLALLIAGLAIAFGALAIYAGQAFRKITTTPGNNPCHTLLRCRLVKVFVIKIAKNSFLFTVFSYAICCVHFRI